MADALRRWIRRPDRGDEPSTQPLLSFGSWDALEGAVLAVCHPHWRGVRTAAYAFGDPVVETEDAAPHATTIVGSALKAGVTTLVVHGFPPGTEKLLQVARRSGLSTRVVVHSSMAQHGAEAGEASVMDRIVGLTRTTVVQRVGFVKAGLAEAFRALGIPAAHTPNRAPVMPAVGRLDPGPGTPHLGVFGANYWRKNVVTQLGAVALLGGTAHVITRPAVAYLEGMAIQEHGELNRDTFLTVQAGMDLNLYVTLSECYPMGPLESFLSGVPALLSRTSDVFRSDRRLWNLVTVATVDNPVDIAAAARRLLDNRTEAMESARAWVHAADAEANRTWHAFVA